ncbi:heme biosynthesis protein HemY [Kiloniella sp. b19]|uniref:heme biosynthesis protein HemY n=1 Tax=Kiloniella sp. GXU_MW_B19 TaxID=3141326 RepID=UPI0031D95D32
MIHKSFLYFLKLAVVVITAVWIANRPGIVSVEWLGYRIETSVGIVILMVLALLVVVALLYRFWRSVLGLPGLWGRSRRERKRSAGYHALMQGMTAVAAGDAALARRQADKARNLLSDEASLTLLLTAQSAQLSNDEATATRAYEEMMAVPEMALLGIRGLMNQAQKRGDVDTALALARQAQAISPKTPWVSETLFALSEQVGDLSTAETALLRATKSGAVPRSDAERKRAILKREQAVKLLEEGKVGEALAAAKAAYKLVPSLVPVVTVYVEALIQAGNKRDARKVLKKAWASEPHRDLATAFLLSCDEQDPVRQVRELALLVDSKADHRESHIVMARANLKARLWGAARRHLDAIAEEKPSRTVCQLMAQLEQGEHGNTARAAEWLQRSETAQVPMAWVCSNCGGAADHWTAHCGHCNQLDGLSWSRPAWQTQAEPGAVDFHGKEQPSQDPEIRAAVPVSAPVPTEKDVAPASSLPAVTDGAEKDKARTALAAEEAVRKLGA